MSQAKLSITWKADESLDKYAKQGLITAFKILHTSAKCVSNVHDPGILRTGEDGKVDSSVTTTSSGSCWLEDSKIYYHIGTYDENTGLIVDIGYQEFYEANSCSFHAKGPFYYSPNPDTGRSMQELYQLDFKEESDVSRKTKVTATVMPGTSLGGGAKRP